MKRLMNKVVVVTGAASGIGLASAKACHSEGAIVVLTDPVSSTRRWFSGLSSQSQIPLGVCKVCATSTR
ncbi:MAG: SDR family NAD(P)-dependent oxidoreductase [Betaproteobacteria bacterium]|nr:SDR family NAD(P)-dependent oxidoreductase [Betaproteobacteria bacterium]